MVPLNQLRAKIFELFKTELTMPYLTCFSCHLIIFIQQEVLGRLGAEGEGGQLEDGGDSGDGQQPWPAIISAKYVVHAQHLGQKDGEGDDQLVDGTKLKTKKRYSNSEERILLIICSRISV